MNPNLMTTADITASQRAASGMDYAKSRAGYKKRLRDRDLTEFMRQSEDKQRMKLAGDTLSGVLTAASLAAGGTGLLAASPAAGATAAEKAALAATSMNRGASLAGALSGMSGGPEMGAIGQLGKAGMERFAEGLPVAAEVAPSLSDNPTDEEIQRWLAGGTE